MNVNLTTSNLHGAGVFSSRQHISLIVLVALTALTLFTVGLVGLLAPSTSRLALFSFGLPLSATFTAVGSLMGISLFIAFLKSRDQKSSLTSTEDALPIAVQESIKIDEKKVEERPSIGCGSFSLERASIFSEEDNLSVSAEREPSVSSDDREVEERPSIVNGSFSLERTSIFSEEDTLSVSAEREASVSSEDGSLTAMPEEEEEFHITSTTRSMADFEQFPPLFKSAIEEVASELSIRDVQQHLSELYGSPEQMPCVSIDYEDDRPFIPSFKSDVRMILLSDEQFLSQPIEDLERQFLVNKLSLLHFRLNQLENREFESQIRGNTLGMLRSLSCSDILACLTTFDDDIRGLLSPKQIPGVLEQLKQLELSEEELAQLTADLIPAGSFLADPIRERSKKMMRRLPSHLIAAHFSYFSPDQLRLLSAEQLNAESFPWTDILKDHVKFTALFTTNRETDVTRAIYKQLDSRVLKLLEPQIQRNPRLQTLVA